METRMKEVTLDNMKYVPEEYVRQAARIERVINPNNTFDRLLVSANQFRVADLTPMFFFDEDDMSLYVTTKEKMEKKFH
jgi:hypothetical protein